MKTIIHTHTHRHDARVFYRYISGRNRSSCHVCARACEDRAEHVYIARTCCGRVRVAVVIRQEANVKINRLPVCALPRRTGCSPPRRRNSIIPSRDEARVCGSIYVSFHARSFPDVLFLLVRTGRESSVLTRPPTLGVSIFRSWVNRYTCILLKDISRLYIRIVYV